MHFLDLISRLIDGRPTGALFASTINPRTPRFGIPHELARAGSLSNGHEAYEVEPGGQATVAWPNPDGTEVAVAYHS